MKTIVAVIAVLGLAGGSLASPVGCGPDCLGMAFLEPDGSYFPCRDFWGGELALYLVLTDATETTGVSAWECHVDSELAPGTVPLGWELMGEAINISTPPDFVVGLSYPLPYSEDIVLAALHLWVAYDECSYFETRAADDPTIPGSPAYIPAHDPGLIIPLTVGSARIGYEPARLNCICVIPTEQDSWGAVKAIYQ
jgi:hypothetical protein